MHNTNKVCSSQDSPEVGQEKEKRQRRKRGGAQSTLGMAPVPEQGQGQSRGWCDPYGASDSGLNQMRNVLVPSPRKVQKGPACATPTVAAAQGGGD